MLSCEFLFYRVSLIIIFPQVPAADFFKRRIMICTDRLSRGMDFGSQPVKWAGKHSASKEHVLCGAYKLSSPVGFSHNLVIFFRCLFFFLAAARVVLYSKKL